AVLLPDLSARVSMLSFDQLPVKSEEQLALVKFRLKKTVPFDVDDAVIAWNVRGREVLVAVTPRVIVRQYEAIFERLGYLPGQVTVSTLAGLGLVAEASDASSGSMLLRKSGNALTIALSSRQGLRMLRAAEHGEE